MTLFRTGSDVADRHRKVPAGDGTWKVRDRTEEMEVPGGMRGTQNLCLSTFPSLSF